MYSRKKYTYSKEPRVAAQVERWAVIPVDACSNPGLCNKSCDL